ncbi:MAG: POT family MFS transporter [Deltaproteobacteria bacterium]|nr:POT family MFS transporter [Deltaproteobacteria bacterium]
MTSKYLTEPVPGEKTMPKGIPFIIGNEAAERFSYYGMRTILVVFMTQYLVGADGNLDTMSADEAKGWYHLFGSAVYALPAVGAIVSDAWWGKYNTILRVSIIYCLGHLALALDESRVGLAIGLSLIAVGSGGIKPCVTAHVGDQFGKANEHLLSKVISWFYFSINFGSFFATMLTPWLLERYGPHVAFGLPGLLMLVATILFYMGRKEFVHVPPKGLEFVKEAFSAEGLRALGKLVLVMMFLAPYYALFEQQGSSWILQAKHMDRTLPLIGEVLPSQVHSVNPLLVMVLVPLSVYVVYPVWERFTPCTPLRKIGLGFFVVASSFLVCAWVETQIQAGLRPTILWQIFAYVLMTAGEVLISVTSLEFFYTQAPRKMKSAIMSIKMFAVSLGNLVTAGVNFLIMNDDGSSKLPGATYYLFFAAMLVLNGVIFIPVARSYKEKSYMQGD